jgi:hypothetical protein
MESIGHSLSVRNRGRGHSLACYIGVIQFLRSIGDAKPLHNDNLLRFIVQAVPGGNSVQLAEAANEAFRLQDITKEARFAEFGPYFDILCLWSNMGLFRGKGVVEHMECHLRGPGSNPIVSGHPITCAHADGALTMALTLTFSPGMHARETVEFMGAAFARFVGVLAKGEE